MSAVLVWFAFALDESCLLQSVRAARHHAPACARHVIMDQNASLRPATVAELRAGDTRCDLSQEDRKGNLNGLGWLDNQLSWLAAAGAGADWVIKIDSDTILNSPPEDWLRYAGPGHMAVCAWQPKWWFQGPCYALRAGTPQALRDRLAARPQALESLAPRYPEDTATGHLLAEEYGPDGILALPGGSTETLFNGTQIAHYNLRNWPAFELYHGFSTIHFGNRLSLPQQMPETVLRHTVAKVMKAYLDSRRVPC